MRKKSYAKVNIFLKIAGKRGDYHEIVSRFVKVGNLFDTITFESGNFKEFTLIGDFGCTVYQNTLYKAYTKLSEISQTVGEYFTHHKVVVEKKIPEFAGLGGGSSNCATFILMVNEVCKLGLSKDEMAKIGATIGADVPFFIYEYESANVRGIGEIVEKFEEEPLDIKTLTPPIKCDTGAIFKEFRKNFYKEIAKEEATKLLKMKSCDILKSYSKRECNDLYLPACATYKELEKFDETCNYFSGSGSSFFKIVEK